MALELVWGADFCCNRHCRTSPVVLEGFWGQVWPKIGRKPEESEFRIANEPLSYAVSSEAVGISLGPGRGRGFPARPGRIGRRPGHSRPPKAGAAGPTQKHKAEIIAVYAVSSETAGKREPATATDTQEALADLGTSRRSGAGRKG